MTTDVSEYSLEKLQSLGWKIREEIDRQNKSLAIVRQSIAVKIEEEKKKNETK